MDKVGRLLSKIRRKLVGREEAMEVQVDINSYDFEYIKRCFKLIKELEKEHSCHCTLLKITAGNQQAKHLYRLPQQYCRQQNEE